MPEEILDETDDEALTNAESELLDEDEDEEDNDREENEISASIRSNNEIALSSGEALNASQALQITQQFKTRVIMLAGDVESGKTTLLATLFLCFQNGLIADHYFAGSETLMGFERRCWKARAGSLRITPETQRTAVEETQKYLHLKLKKKNEENFINLLFCDLSGEVFERAINSIDEALEIKELKRADHLTVLVNGDSLRRLDKRHNAVSNARLLLLSLLDAKAVDSTTPIEILFTKTDLFEGGATNTDKENLITSLEETNDFIEQTKQEIMHELKSRGVEPHFFTVAVRSSNQKFKLGTGLDVLLPVWTADLPTPKARFVEAEKPMLSRELEKFYHRELLKTV